MHKYTNMLFILVNIEKIIYLKRNYDKILNYSWDDSMVYLEGKINRKAIYCRQILGSMFKKRSNSHESIHLTNKH